MRKAPGLGLCFGLRVLVFSFAGAGASLRTHTKATKAAMVTAHAM